MWDFADGQDFQYVVERKEQEPICFLSTQERFPPPKLITKITPTYLDPYKNSAINKLLTKVRSNRGVGGLADLASRFQKMRLDQIPPPNKYVIDKQKPIRENIYPFGKSFKKHEIFTSITPGPGTYELPKICRRPIKVDTFGGPMRLKPTVEVICNPHEKDECAICQKICFGDYWHFEYSTFLCLRCMRAQRKLQNKFNLNELNEFKKIRNCSFMHRHEGTTAAIRLLPKHALCTKFRKENYLEVYSDKYN